MSSGGKQKYKIIVPVSRRSGPSFEELSAAEILCEYFKCNIEIIPRGPMKSADFLIKGVFWELKSPTGGGKRTIQHQFSRGLKQARHIIIDGRFSKFSTEKMVSELNRQSRLARGIAGLILITKNKKVTIFL